MIKCCVTWHENTRTGDIEWVVPSVLIVCTSLSTFSPTINQIKCHILGTKDPWQPRPIKKSIESWVKTFTQRLYIQHTWLTVCKTELPTEMELVDFLKREKRNLPEDRKSTKLYYSEIQEHSYTFWRWQFYCSRCQGQDRRKQIVNKWTAP